MWNPGKFQAFSRAAVDGGADSPPFVKCFLKGWYPSGWLPSAASLKLAGIRPTGVALDRKSCATSTSRKEVPANDRRVLAMHDHECVLYCEGGDSVHDSLNRVACSLGTNDKPRCAGEDCSRTASARLISCHSAGLWAQLQRTLAKRGSHGRQGAGGLRPAWWRLRYDRLLEERGVP